MSWLAGLAGKAENLLNKMDQSAAEAFHSDALQETQNDTQWATSQDQRLSVVTSSGQVASNHHQSTPKPSSPTKTALNNPMSVSQSVPSNLNKLDRADMGYTNQMSKSMYSSGQTSGSQTPTKPKNNKDQDEELFEFLNSSNSGAKKKERPKPVAAVLNGKHSRQSSTSSTTSRGSSKTPEPVNVAPAPVVPNGPSVPDEQEVIPQKQSTEESDSLEQSSSEAADDILMNNDSSSGYHSNQEEGSSQKQLSALELENRLLKNEIASLNEEMASVIQRSKSAQEELHQFKKKMSTHNEHLTQSDQIVRELRARESDFTEALSVKDSQLAILRVRLEEADKAMAEKQKTVVSLQAERQRVLQDHTSATDVHGQALDSLKQKLAETEAALRRQLDSHTTVQQESLQRQSKLETEQHGLVDSLTTTQRKLAEEKMRCAELGTQVKTQKGHADAAKQELQDYKDKAARILQSKDRLISSLKDGTAGSLTDSGVSAAEVEELRQEKDMYREEVQQARMTVEQLRTEVQDLEVQMQTDADAAQDSINSLEEQFHTEKRRREDAELEVSKQKEELRYANEELVKQKTGLQSRIQDREAEIERLRHQLTNKSMSSSSQTELENRLHALTESLIQKQTMLEALSTEKNSLGLQLERLEQQYKTVQASAVRANATTVVMNEDDDMRQRVPSFMRESPLDNEMTRKVKRAAGSIDKFSIRLGIFLRRYPIARVFVIVYMALLHLWVMVVLLTYQPEMHGSDYHPKPPMVP